MSENKGLGHLEAPTGGSGAAQEPRSGSEVFNALPDDAKAVFAAWFGMMAPGKGSVTLHLRESEPSPRTGAALAVLLDAGAISVEPFNRFGGRVYRPLINAFPTAFNWLRTNAKRPDLQWPLRQPARPEANAPHEPAATPANPQAEPQSHA